MLCIQKMREHNSTNIFYPVSSRTNNLCYFIGTLLIRAYQSNILLSGLWNTFLKTRSPTRKLLRFTFELKYRAAFCLYAATLSRGCYIFSSSKSRLNFSCFSFCSGWKCCTLYDGILISTGTTASIPNTKEYGVSLGVVVCVVLYNHNTNGS